MSPLSRLIRGFRNKYPYFTQILLEGAAKAALAYSFVQVTTAYLSRPMPQWLRAAFGGHKPPAREAFPVESYVGAGTDKKQHEGKSKRAIDSTVHVIGYTPHQ